MLEEEKRLNQIAYPNSPVDDTYFWKLSFTVTEDTIYIRGTVRPSSRGAHQQLSLEFANVEGWTIETYTPPKLPPNMRVLPIVVWEQDIINYERIPE